MIRTGYTSPRISGYTSGRRRIMPDVAVVLGNAIGFNSLWLYHANLEMGITSLDLKEKIKEKLESGWRTPPPNVKRGRPKRKENGPSKHRSKR